MIAPIRRIRESLATGPNRIALVWAVRGTIATGLPLAVLPYFGLGLLANFVVMGAMNTSMVDTGGSYRDRLVAMALNTMLSPVAIVLATQSRHVWWLAATLMFGVALLSGLARAFGPSGIALGLTAGLAFLVGIGVPGPTDEAFLWAILYVAGGVWTILIALAFWRLRPYKRLEQEVAAAWERTAELVAAARAAEPRLSPVVRRRRKERRVAKQQLAVREAIERVLASIGTVRAGTSGPGVMIAQLLILVRSASRVAAAAVTLSEIAHETGRSDRNSLVGSAIQSVNEELETACRAIAAALVAGKGSLSLESAEERLAAFTSLAGTRTSEAVAFSQAVRYLENAAEALEVLLGTKHSFAGALPPILSSLPRIRAIATLKAHLSFRSAIFRHALRCAVAVAGATAVVGHLQLQHGIWVPMATLIVLQPEFGGTFARALQRSGGTIAGAALAGFMLATLSGTAAFEPLLIILLFGAFLVLRRSYALGVTFLTPLVVLLLAHTEASPWWDTFERIIDTVLGAALGVAAGYVLWPQWERERIPALLANAIRANRGYMSALFQSLGAASPNLPELRRRAELEVGNAQGAFQRLLAEPRRHRGRINRAFAVVIYVQRLERHLISLSEQIGLATLERTHLDTLAALLEKTQDDIAAAIDRGRMPTPCPPFDQVLAGLREELLGGDGAEPGRIVAFLLGRVVSDTISLHTASMMKRLDGPQPAHRPRRLSGA